MRYTWHAHHMRAMCWFGDVDRYHPFDRLATCSITEIGFVRIAGNQRANLANHRRREGRLGDRRYECVGAASCDRGNFRDLVERHSQWP